ncbi:putative quinol monooxygenase [Alloiococcus sp. CFN-8]|uniref:putative quinol monooxygenase n=1 Tax=Alloiococcus sp. CFN-8 TaxID=3416081 RepID=UPI003CF4C24C
MIRVIASKRVKEDKLQEVLRITEELVRETVKEKGCISYEGYQDINDPQKIIILEAWESEEDLKAHQETDHFTRLVPMMGDMTEENYGVNILKKVF